MTPLEELEPKVAEAARLMEMLSQPVRLKILCLLLEGERSVLQLADTAGLSQPAMSHHLRKLREADLVETRRSAQTIYYSLRGREVRAVLATLHDLYCAPAMTAAASRERTAERA
ncbi:MAG: winged helix-turn-helix transcriptional regulator [Nitratireductor sp.]|nr:winged helix-turn-helix transcriptional regulator [Nitratireductor sp.]